MNKLNILFFSLLLILTSCDSQIDYSLRTVETLMDSRPDSSLYILRSIDSLKLDSKRKKAKYALLLSQALDKNYINETNDSIIKIAVNYYESQKVSREKMLAYYYLARIQYHNRSYLQGLKSCLYADFLADEIGDFYYKGLISFSLIDIYRQTHLYHDVLKESENAINSFAKAGKESHLDWAYYYKALSLIGIDSMSAGKSLLDSVYCVASNKKDKGLMSMCHHLYINYYNQCKNELEGDSVIFYAKRVSNLSDYDCINIASYYLYVNCLDSAKYYLDKIQRKENDYGKAFVNYEYARYYYKSKDYENAYNLLNNTLSSFISLYESYLKEGISTYQTEFYKKKMEEEIAISAKNKKIGFAIFSICLISGLILCVHFRRKITKNKEELLATLEIASSLRKELVENEDSSNLFRNDINELLRNHLETLTDLNDVYYKVKNDKKEEKYLLNKVKEIIRSLQDENKMSEIKKIIDRHNGNLASNIYMEAEKKNVYFTKREKSVFLYILSSISPITISYLLDLSSANYYTTKSRLKSKLLSIDTEETKEIIANYF